MRTFIILIAFAATAACAGNNTNCGQTTGCVGGDDGGDPTGSAGASIAGPSSNGGCGDPAYPVDCGDGWCWPAGTDCSLKLNECDSQAITYRCKSADQWANCCEGEVHVCPADKPYFCPSSGACESQTCPIQGEICQYRGLECD